MNTPEFSPFLFSFNAPPTKYPQFLPQGTVDCFHIHEELKHSHQYQF